MNVAEIIQEILGEATDEELDSLDNAVRTRREILVKMKAATLTKGTLVKTDGLRPKYLNGLIGTVQSISRNGNRADVMLTNGTEKRAQHPRYVRPDGTLPGVPISCLRVMDGVTP